MTAPVRGERGTWQWLALWTGGFIDLGATKTQLPVDDESAARLIGAERPGELHCAVASGTWHIWDGRCHRPDYSGEMNRIVLGFGVRLNAMLEAARKRVNQDVLDRLGAGAGETALKQAAEQEWAGWKAAEKYAAKLRNNAGVTSLLGFLAKGFSYSDAELADQHPRWLNCVNGTVDLETGQLREHDPADLITYSIPVAWNPEARCPMFWSMLCRMTGNSYEVAAYVLKVLGYCLLGENPERKIFFINGPTSSGKSQLLHIVSEVIGPLAHNSSTDLICVRPQGRNARVENSIRGKRLLTITETSDYMAVDEGQVKRLTGERKISVNQHYAKAEIETAVSFTIVIATNHMPSITNFEEAMRVRVVVIPGGPTIPEDEQDPRLPEKIITDEAEGVLAMLIRGCIEYHRSGGLELPVAVQVATDAYRGEQNTVTNFLADYAILTPAGAGEGEWQGYWDLGAEVEMTDSWDLYRRWARGSEHLTRNEFYEHLARQPGITRDDSSHAHRVFRGLRWNAKAQRILAGERQESS